jgi:thioredoxin-like negative regulator of GroEL
VPFGVPFYSAMSNRKQLLEQFVAQDAGDSFSRYALALELEKEGKEIEAVEQLREVIARDCEYVAAYQQLGRLLAHGSQIEEARETYRKGVEVAITANDQRARSEMQEALEMIG